MNEYSKTINLNLYRVFYYVAKEKNINKAAKKLYISQPAVSKSLKKLEEILHTKLFDRSIKGVSLTKAGEVLMIYIEKSYQNIILAEQELKKLDN